MVKCKYRITTAEYYNQITEFKYRHKLLSKCTCRNKRYSNSVEPDDELIIDNPLVCFDCNDREE